VQDRTQSDPSHTFLSEGDEGGPETAEGEIISGLLLYENGERKSEFAGVLKGEMLSEKKLRLRMPYSRQEL